MNSAKDLITPSAMPLTGGDRIKVVIYFLVLAGTVFFGIISIIISLAGIYVMKKDKSFSPIYKSKKYIRLYIILLALSATIITTMENYNSKIDGYYDYNIRSQIDEESGFFNSGGWRSTRDMEERERKIYIAKIKKETATTAISGLILTPISVYLLMLLFSVLYFRPLEKHQEWVVKNGIFSDLEDANVSTGIMGRDKLSSFSIADELIKWNDLLEKKLISQEEFDKAKQRLLK